MNIIGSKATVNKVIHQEGNLINSLTCQLITKRIVNEYQLRKTKFSICTNAHIFISLQILVRQEVVQVIVQHDV